MTRMVILAQVLRCFVAVTLVLSSLRSPAMADVTVDTALDVDDGADGKCSLREAIIAVNTNADYHGCARTPATVDTISFTLGAGTPSIAVTGSDLPQMTGPTIVDGATGGATRVEIGGGGTIATGLSFLGATDASGSAIRNLVINGFTNRQLLLSNGDNMVVEGNLIGVDPTGTSRINTGRAIENCAGFGCGSSSGHHIGGPTAAQRNVIVTGTSAAIDVGGSGVVIQGNFINTNATGTANLGGAFPGGISLNNVANTVIGGDQPGEGNVITGFNSIIIGGNTSNARSSNTVIQGNRIGTDVTGSVSLQTGGDGIVLSHAVDTLIGGTTPGAGNLISGNHDGVVGGSSGVSGGSVDNTTVQGNLIGTDAAGTSALGNSGFGIVLGDDAVIESNVVAFNGGDGIQINCGACIQTMSQNGIHSNGGIGIDLNGGNDGATDNDVLPGDPDPGPNGLQNFPILATPVFSGGVSISGTLNSTPGHAFRIEVFSNFACDPSLHGEGETFVGTVDTAATNGNGDVSFTVTFGQSLPATLLTATATDLTTGATSEFSACPVVPVPTATRTATPIASLTPTPTGGLAASATPTVTPTPVVGVPLGHFVGYQAKVAKTAPKFFKLGPVTLADSTLGFTADYVVVKPNLLALPANKNGEGFTDPLTHLEAYAVKLAKGSPKFLPRVDVAVTNQCGDLVLTAKKPARLLVPTGVGVAQPAPHNVDHFLCYQAKAQKKLANGTPIATFPKHVQVDVVDAFSTRRYDLKKVAFLCLPVAKSGSPQLLAGPKKGTPFGLTPSTVGSPGSFLVCYGAKLATKDIPQSGCGPANPADKGTKIVPKQAKHVPRLVQVGNQLGGGALDTKKESLVCVPSGAS